MQITANQIAAMVQGVVEGDGNVAISTFAKIEEGHPGAISFLANPKYTHYIYTTKSSAVLVNNDFVAEQPVATTLIRVADPYSTVAQLLQIASEMIIPKYTGVEQPSFVAQGVEIPADAYIGAFSYIGRGVKLGKGVKIYPQAYVGDGVTIGENSIIYPGVKIYYGCRIGARCVIHAGAVIGSDGFGFAPDANGVYSKIPQLGIVEIADDVEIGANTTIDRSTMGATRVARGVKLDNLIQLAHNVEIGQNTVIASQAGVAGSAKVGANCMIGGQVGIAGHISVGDRVSIGAQSGVPSNVATGSTIMGYPAVPAGDFRRQSVYIKNLAEIFSDVRAIKRELSKNKEQ